MDLDAAKSVLVQEARELLADMEAALLAIEDEGATPEHINALFRAAHTIKGSAGLFGLDLIVGFTHVMESVMVRVRNGELGLDGDMSSLMLGCNDYVSSLIDALAAGEESTDPDPAVRKMLIDQLERHLGAEADHTVAAPAETQATTAGQDGWHLSLRFSPDLLRTGMDPLSFIRYLGQLGQVSRVETITDALPRLADIDPEGCYLGFEIDLLTDKELPTVLQTFEFIADDSTINATAINPRSAAPVVEEVAATTEGSPAAKQAKKPVAEAQAVIKVEAQKLDQLIDSVGEMVITAASARLLSGNVDNPQLREAMTELEALVERIRDRALNLRMTPIGEVFQRFPRVVRDVSKELGKKIELVISGADAELDKSMVDKLSDPLLHIVRNAIDHGIDSPEERLAAGKPESGTVKLNAYHESGSIVVEIIDDGRGLNKDRIKAKAIERGLITADTQLADGEIFSLIFEAGFSTAEKVTDLSGRGVGMDVVRRNIEQLRGTVEIESAQGKGSTFRIRLPLTLAIIDGFLVGVGKAAYVIPLDAVVECIDLADDDAETLQDRSYINLRGEVLPFLRLKELFEIDSAAVRRESVVVVKYGNTRAGLVVDNLLGEFQTVIKPLGKLFERMRCIGGSTILGNGQVALILDVPNLVQHYVQTSQADETKQIPARTA
jgi:two-component system chemotaxis sensor kinase CheA